MVTKLATFIIALGVALTFGYVGLVDVIVDLQDRDGIGNNTSLSILLRLVPVVFFAGLIGLTSLYIYSKVKEES